MTNAADDTRLMEDFGFSNLDNICIFDNFSTSGTLHDGDTVGDALDDDPTALRDSLNITEFHRGCSLVTC